MLNSILATAISEEIDNFPKVIEQLKKVEKDLSNKERIASAEERRKKQNAKRLSDKEKGAYHG